VRHNQDFNYQDIAREAGLSRFTVASIANNASNRIELSTINKLLRYFDKMGMTITPGDLFATDNGH
jgi:DNA-binding Xre family transcriptional regulator